MAASLAVLCGLLATPLIVGSVPGAAAKDPGSAAGGLAAVEHVRIEAHDGVLLNGYVALPTGPQRNLPTVLINTPYMGGCVPAHVTCPAQPSWDDHVPPSVADSLDENLGSYWDEWETGDTVVRFGNSLGFPLIHLVKAGYAVALVSVRGTGDSGGCFEFGGKNEQQDSKLLVEWLARQSWSNHKIAMGGLSYASYTTWQAAVQAPKALKATITAGELTHPWEFSFTPQGARNSTSLSVEPALTAGFAAHAPGPESHLDFQPTLCPGQVVAQAHHLPDWAADARDQKWFAERSLRERMKHVRAAALSSHGFLEIAAHGFQDSLMWESLSPTIPKRFIRGWWRHTWPSAYAPNDDTLTTLDPAWAKPGWEAIVLEWLDAHLRGGPRPQREGVMDFFDGTSWRASSRGWNVPQEVLYLSDSAVRTTPASESTTFRDVPLSSVNSSYGAATAYGVQATYDAPVCEPDTANGTVAAVYDSAPLPHATVLAGNPFAYLNVSSDQPRGLVNVELYDVAPDARCADPSSDTGTVGVRWISSGTADLAFYRSPFLATPFPVNSPQRVRVDLLDTAASVPAGHHLRVVVSYGSAVEHRTGRLQDVPLITIGGDSQLVLPVFYGTLSGHRPAQSYPPRPFLP